MKRVAASTVLLLALVGCSTPTTTTEVAPGDGPAASVDTPEPVASSVPEVATFKEKYIYDDGLEVEVIKVDTAKLGEYASLSEGKAKAGTKYSVLKVRVRNGSKIQVEAIGSAAVSYGPDGDPAVQVFDEGVGQGITGTVLPDKAKSGTYGFIVPKKYLGDATLEFNADFEHDPAVFSGSLK